MLSKLRFAQKRLPRSFLLKGLGEKEVGLLGYMPACTSFRADILVDLKRDARAIQQVSVQVVTRTASFIELLLNC